MSLRRRIFLTLCLVVLVGFFSIARWIRGELRNSYSQVVEEMLIDEAHLISSFIENEKMSQKGFKSLAEMFDRQKHHDIRARVFDFIKVNPSLDLYVTDNKGIVVFSTTESQIGQDFSKWNDVYRTLRGEYGARSTRTNPTDNRTSVYFVAAPIRIGTQIVGVATISKTENSILIFLDRALEKMFLGALVSALFLGVLGGLIMLWITLPLEKLRLYALDVSEGRRGVLPQSKIKEVKHLSEAFEKMRITLEGKKTVETYTQNLTHELKSPLTAIKGAAELCLEEMDQSQRQRFLENIIGEADRSHHLLEQLLKIAALESTQKLEKPEAFDLYDILQEAREALMGLWKLKKIRIEIMGPEDRTIQGDRFLLFQAFRNVLQNAIEFSDDGSLIRIEIEKNDASVSVEIIDTGCGIPAFAKDRVFEKFYSLERPSTKRRSSGLGLNFFKEVMDLHGAQIAIQSPVAESHGTSVRVEF